MRQTGPLVTAENQVPELVCGILLPNRMQFTLHQSLDTKEKARNHLKSWPNARIYHIIDHEPVLTDNYRAAIEQNRLTLEDVIRSQRLKDTDGSWFIDDYGFHIYAVPILSLTGEPVGEDRVQTGPFTRYATY